MRLIFVLVHLLKEWLLFSLTMLLVSFAAEITRFRAQWRRFFYREDRPGFAIA